MRQKTNFREDASQKPLGVSNSILTSKIKQQNEIAKWDEDEEIEILREQLDPEEMYILGFLKGFDRKTLKDWNEKGLMDFSVRYK